MAADNDLLQQLHAVVGKQLLERIQSGEASASDFAQAIKFLSDNDITSENDPNLNGMFKELAGKMPFSDPNDPTSH